MKNMSKKEVNQSSRLTKPQLILSLIFLAIGMSIFAVGLFKYNINGMLGILGYPYMLLMKEVSKLILPDK